jgi:hypothetical protein
MVNVFGIFQLISGILFGTLSMVSLINAMMGIAMGAIVGMAISEVVIAYCEKHYRSSA